MGRGGSRHVKAIDDHLILLYLLSYDPSITGALRTQPGTKLTTNPALVLLTF